jgi:hypothetical protein
LPVLKDLKTLEVKAWWKKARERERGRSVERSHQGYQGTQGAIAPKRRRRIKSINHGNSAELMVMFLYELSLNRGSVEENEWCLSSLQHAIK